MLFRSVKLVTTYFIKNMVKFEIKPYGSDGDFLLTRHEDVEWGEGLPPTNSSTIMMNESDLIILMNTLRNYANKRANKNVQYQD